MTSTHHEGSTGSHRAGSPPGSRLGPGSLLWDTAGDPRSLLPGTAAGIMQLMLPGLGAGVSEHSNFFDDPFDRIFRSIPVIWGSIFAQDDVEGDERGRFIRDLHRDIKGTDAHGDRYHALDPDVYWWAHATFTWEFLRARELFFAVPLSRAQKQQLYAESVTWYRRYGVSERPVPANLDAFEARFEEVCREELELTPAVRWVLDPTKNPTAAPPRVDGSGPRAAVNRRLVALRSELASTVLRGCMPSVVRRRLDLEWTSADRARFALVCTTLRSAGPAVRRGFMTELFPEGTPHLEPGSRSRVVIAPGTRQK